MRWGRQRDERASVSVLVAFFSVTMFVIAAMAVDLGNAMTRKRDVQSQADFAALAAGSHLAGTKTSGDPAVLAVADYLNKNQPLDEDGDPCQVTKSCVSAAALVDGVDANGEVYFSDGGNKLRVVAPEAYVDFGLANVLGATGMDVQSDATVAVLSPKGRGVLPMYVAMGQGCDYGLQTLTDPAGGHVVTPAVPTLAFDSDTNQMTLQGPLVPDQVALGASGVSVQITANRYRDVTRVGFFRGDNPDPALVIGDAPGEVNWVSPATPPPAFTANNGTITVTIPNSVTAVEAVWYVRLFQAGGTNRWSARSEALPLRVGDTIIECQAGSQDGNFGTLKIPRSSNPSNWIPMNIALGLEAPLSLAKFPRDPVPWQCSASDPEAVLSDQHTRLPGTNCLDTDTGLTAETATEGFIAGGSGYSGLLASNTSSADPDGSGGCAPNGTTSPVNSGVRGQLVNNDILTCFLTDTTTTLATIANRNYNGGPRLHPDIYKSPRFAWVPVFVQEVATGGSGHYSIIDFRPVFITEQPLSATKANNAVGSSTNNGLGVSSNKLETIKVIFFNANALPPGDGDSPTGPFLGTGPPVIRLVD